MNLYNQRYFNRRNWMLEKYKDLNISKDEFIILLMIDYLNEFNQTVSVDALSVNCKIEAGKVDEILEELMNKGYLKMIPVNRKISYSLEGLFVQSEEGKPYESNTYKNLFQLFEQEFGRPLSQKESETLSEWITKYDLKLIEYALREAIINNKKSLNYIDAILFNWKEKNITAKKYEEGNS